MQYRNQINELYKKRNSLIEQMRSLVARSEDNGEPMPATDVDQFEALKKAVADLDARMKKLEEMATFDESSRDADTDSDSDEEELDTADRRAAPPSYSASSAPASTRAQSAFHALAFRKALCLGTARLTGAEKRAIIQSDDAQGGYLRPYEEFVADLIKAVDNEVPFQARCPKFTLTKAKRIRMPSYDTIASQALWTQELTTAPADTAMAFGGRMIEANPLSKLVKISVDMLNEANIDGDRSADGSVATGPIENFLKAEIARAQGYAIEEAYMTGNGVGRPLGLFVASDDGVPTSADISTDIATNGNLADKLISCRYAMKQQYRKRAEWLFSRQILEQIRLLKDGNGRYMYTTGDDAILGDRLLGIPVTESEFVPNTLANNTYIGALADFSFYQTVDTKTVAWYELREMFITSGQVGFLVVVHRGGKPLLAEAFKRLKYVAP